MVYGPAFTVMPDPPGPNATRVGAARFAFCSQGAAANTPLPAGHAAPEHGDAHMRMGMRHGSTFVVKTSVSVAMAAVGPTC